MSQVPDAWEDEWSSVADVPGSSSSSAAQSSKKVSSKVTKAQKRAQQAEFNRQLWADAEAPRQTNYFLESRNIVPLRQEFKPPTVLLSRKGPIVKSPRPNNNNNNDNNNNSLNDLLTIDNLQIKDESSEDEDEIKARELTLAERQAQAAKDREEKQRKYEERRLELFGPNGQQHVHPATVTAAATITMTSRSGNSSPASGTPPHSRSSTPSRGTAGGAGAAGGGGGGGGGILGRRGRGRGNNNILVNGNGHPRQHQQHTQPAKELYDAAYTPKPDSVFLQRREQGMSGTNGQTEILPVRTPRGPDGTVGFNFAVRSRPSTDKDVNGLGRPS